MKNILYILLSIILLSSCEGFFEREIKPEIIERENFLVLGAIFRNETPDAKIHLSVSSKLLESQTDKQDMSDAVVSLSSAAEFSQPFIYRFTNRYWYNFHTNAPLTFETGVTYTISAKKEGYPSITANCTMPSHVPIRSIDFRENAGVDNEGGKVSAIDITVQDPAGEKNYYKAHAQLQTVVNGSTTSRAYWIRDQDVEFSRSVQSNAVIISDVRFDGEEKKLTFYIDRLSESSFNDNHFLELEWSSITQDQYLFDKRLYINKENNDNPFVSPTPLHSNVKNGQGIFAIENTKAYRVK